MFNNLEKRHTTFSCSDKIHGISFLPVKNEKGNFNYIPVTSAATESDKNELDYKTAILPSIPSFDVPPEDDNRLNRFSIGEDMIKTFYVGSVTIVGLFILYRLLQKSA
jgi:hypothetical protein